MESSTDLYSECDEIIDGIPNDLTNDEKMRYLYIKMGKKLSKNPDFFYESDPLKQKQIYDNYQNIENREVICRSVVYLYSKLADKLNLKCRPIKMDETNHWALVYENEDKKYLINPMQDFYRVQLGFSTKNFCHAKEYHGYSKESFDSMSDDYLRDLDKAIGYLNSECYTEEVFEKLSTEMRNKLGNHIIKTSDYYQEYYRKLLELFTDNSKTLNEKLKEIAEIDPELEKHEDVVKEVLSKSIMNSKMRRTIHNMAYKKLIGKDFNIHKQREGAQFVGDIDVSELKNMKKQIMIYKFNYMINCLPKHTTALTGYIENKNFIEELSKYIFQTPEEKSCIHRHTVVRKNEKDRNDYYLMFSIRTSDEAERIYCFYDHKNKKYEMPIEPIEFMKNHNMKPLKDSSLNEEIQEFCNNQNDISLKRVSKR